MPKAEPHGNAKSDQAFHPTWPSVIVRMKSQSQQFGPKETVSCVSQEAGGIVGAAAPGKLPRNEHQVSNLRHSQKQPSDSSNDELFVVMSQCKSKDVTAHFIRDVKAGPDPALVIATDQQLNDLVKFCTSPDEFTVITVDPTFNLGDFEVTPITYRHLFLQSERTGKSPVFVGPMLIHYRKDFATFLYFASTLVGLRRDLERLQAFGTDGEKALIDAFSHEFGFAIHLLCAIHLRRNVKQHMQSCNFPDEHRRQTLDDIFGAKRGSVYLEGLIDAKSTEEFDSNLAALKLVWDDREASQPGYTPGFHEWFATNKAEDLKSCAIRPIREAAGLGSPPEMFTTNASEAVNSVLKSKVDYRRSELHKFVEKMQCLVDEQEKELERAVCRRGKYRFRPAYQHLEVEEVHWFNMTPEMRRKHLQKVHGTTLAYDTMASPALTPCEQQCGTSSSDGKRRKNTDVTERATSIVCNSPSCHSEESDRSALSVEVTSFAHTVKTPEPVLQGIWKKAAELVTNPCKMSLAPGCSPLARMVESTSGNKPHLVSPGKGGKFTCDGECPNYKSFAICSHVIAVAEVNCMLKEFISQFQKSKKVPNLSALAKTGLPKGRGRKGGEPARKRRKLPTPETRVALNPTSSHSEDPCCSFSYHGSIPQPQAQVSLSSPPPMLPSAPPPSGLPPLHIPCHSPQSVPPFASPGPPPPLQFQSSPPPLQFQSGPLPRVPAHNVTTLINSGNASTHVVVPQSVKQVSQMAYPYEKPGCKGKYVKPALPPFNLCIQHEEWRQISFGSSPAPSSVFSNAYYHPSLHCLSVNWPGFRGEHLVIPERIKSALTQEHWRILEELRVYP